MSIQDSLPVTEAFAERELTLPLYPSMTESHIETIVSAVSHCRSRYAPEWFCVRWRGRIDTVVSAVIQCSSRAEIKLEIHDR